MAEVMNKTCEALDNQTDKDTFNDNENNNHDNNITKSEALPTKIYSDVEVDGNANSSKPTKTSTANLENSSKPTKPSTANLENSSKPTKPSTADLEILEKLLSEEEMQRKRRRGKRGGRRRGFGSEKNDCSRGGSGPRMQIMQRGERRAFRNQDTSNVADLTKLPDGILLVEDGDYVGYHCTYCNSVLISMPTVKDHVAGFRHQAILEVRNIEKKKKEGNVPQCELESMQNDEKDEKTVQIAVSESTSTKDVSLPLKSYLEDHLLAASDLIIIGLDYIIEKQKQFGEASFECSLCKVELCGGEMKSHIIGTRHRLMYLKTREPQKMAELMTKNLQKAERNKEIKNYIETLVDKHGRGSIIVEHFDSTTTTSGEEKRKRLSGAQRRRKRRRQEPSNPPPQQQTNNYSTTSKSKRGNFYGTRQHKRAVNNGANSSRKRQRETPSPWLQPFDAQQISRREIVSNTPYPWMQPCAPDQFSTDVIANNVFNAGSTFDSSQYSSNYNNRQLFQNEDNRRMDYSFNYSHPSSHLSQDHTTRNREQGSKADLQHLRKPDVDVNNEEEAGVIMNVINSLTERFLQYKLKNIAGPAKKILEKSLKGETLQHALGSLTNENNIRAANRMSSKISAHNRDIDDKMSARDDKSNSALTRDTRDKPQYDWEEDREPTYTRDRMGESLDYFDEARETAYHRGRTNLSLNDWDEITDTPYPKDRMYKSQNSFDNIGDGTYRKDKMDQSQQEWNEDRDIKRSRDIMDWSDNTGDRTYRKDKMDQSQQKWNEDRDIKHPRDIMAWSKPDWNETRYTTCARDVIDQPQEDWNKNGSTLYSKNVINQPRYNWNENKDASSRNMMDQSRCEWNEARDTTSTRNVTEQYQRDWNETRLAREGNRNINSLNQSFRNSNEVKQAGMMKNITSKFSETRYGSSTNSGSFNNLLQTWNLKDSTQKKNSTSSSYASHPSQMQSSSIHPSYVDDLFDKYQKEIKAEKTRSIITNKDLKNHSHTVSSFKPSSNYMGSSATSSFNRPSSFKSSSNYMDSSATSSFNRPSSFGQLSSAAIASKWKYTSFK